MYNENYNEEIADFILRKIYWMKKLKIPKRHWREKCLLGFNNMGGHVKYPKNAFRVTWNFLVAEKKI